MITQSELKEKLNYDQETGIFTWKVKSSNRIKIGNVAGSIGNFGYVIITIDKKHYVAHRLAWLYVNNILPTKDIDHINGNRADNRIENLREATRSENSCNSKLRSNNVSGIKGISWHNAAKKWEASINVNGIKKYLGIFDSKDLAELVITEARNKYHGEFARQQ